MGHINKIVGIPENNPGKRFRDNRPVPAVEPPAPVGAPYNRCHGEAGSFGQGNDAYLRHMRGTAGRIDHETSPISLLKISDHLPQRLGPASRGRPPYRNPPMTTRRLGGELPIVTGTRHDDKIQISIKIYEEYQPSMPRCIKHSFAWVILEIFRFDLLTDHGDTTGGKQKGGENSRKPSKAVKDRIFPSFHGFVFLTCDVMSTEDPVFHPFTIPDDAPHRHRRPGTVLTGGTLTLIISRASLYHYSDKRKRDVNRWVVRDLSSPVSLSIVLQ